MSSQSENKTGPHHSNDEPEQTNTSTQPSTPTEQDVPNVGEANPGHSEQNNSPPVQRRMRFFQLRRPTAQGVWNFLITLSTILLVIITLWQVDLARLEQRAWVGPEGTTYPPEVKADVPLSFGVTIVNTGNTPALQVKTLVSGTVQSSEKAVLPSYSPDPTQVGREAVGLLLPDVRMHLAPPAFELTGQQLIALRNGTQTLYIYGEISYDDAVVNPLFGLMFGKTHCTTFCLALRRDLRHARPCGEYNSVEDTKCENIKY